jgi:hypothetical protein
MPDGRGPVIVATVLTITGRSLRQTHWRLHYVPQNVR